MKSDVSGLKSNFSKLKADIQVSRDVNSKLSERLLTMERRCYANEQYSRRECLEISGIPASVADKDLESKVLEILEEIDVPIDPTLVEDCHRLPSKGSSKKVIVKLNRRKDIHRILPNKNQTQKFKNLNRCTCPRKQKFSSMKICVCATRNCGPNVECWLHFRVLDQEWIAENQAVQ